jgi:hypothetical protein
MPLLTDYLKAIDTRNEQRTASLRASIDSIAQAQSQQSLQLQQLTAGNLTFRLEAPQQLQLLPPPPLPPTVLSSAYTSARASIVATPLARSPSPPLQGLPLQGTSGCSWAQIQAQEKELPEPPQYRMCRTVRTVEALWQEWTVGLQGNPAIEVLDRKWGNRWRAGRQSELQWYSLRLEVMREVRRVAQARGVGEDAAMRQVSLQQQQAGCSLDQFCKMLRAGRKVRASRIAHRPAVGAGKKKFQGLRPPHTAVDMGSYVRKIDNFTIKPLTQNSFLLVSFSGTMGTSSEATCMHRDTTGT